MIWGMENKDVLGRAGSTRRAFLSASAVTAVAVPLLSGTALTETDAALSRQAPDLGLRAMLRDIEGARARREQLRRLVDTARQKRQVREIDMVREDI